MTTDIKNSKKILSTYLSENRNKCSLEITSILISNNHFWELGDSGYF